MKTSAAQIILGILLIALNLSAKTGMKAAASMTFEVENSDTLDSLNQPADSLAKLSNDTSIVVDTTASAQQPNGEVPETHEIPDSVLFQTDSSAADTTAQSKTKEKAKNPDLRDPGLAALFSGLVPGGGQTYNGRYVKAGFFLAAEAAVMYYALDNNSKAQDLWDSRDNMETDTPEWTQAGQDYEAYVNDRNLLLWVFVGLHVVNVLDAFVDAHLSGFPA